VPFPIGILGVVYNVAKDVFRAILKKPDAEEIVRVRKKWKDVSGWFFLEHLL
jgi:hypothetical protein